MTMASCVVAWANEAEEKLDIKTDFMNQISDDWHKKPYTGFKLETGNSCPSTHPHAVFERFWAGMGHGCDCYGIYDRYINTDNTLTKGYKCDRN